MPIPALILPVLIAIAQAPEPEGPIVVTGHFWAPFISPMGEPFRARVADDDTLARWFLQADRNGDGLLSPDEMVMDANRFFATLDTDSDGKIDPDEIRRYEWELAPDVQVMSRTRPAPGETSKEARENESESRDASRKPRRKSGKDYGLQGGARYALLNLPQPVIAADSDFDRAVTLAEFRQSAILRFRLLDSAGKGSLALDQLRELLPSVRLAGREGKRPRKDAPDERIGNRLPSGD
jgi:hypothetical protein